MALRKIARRTLSDSVFEQLSAEILHGRFAVGEQLPAERQLCELLGVNRGALREALKRLAHAGLIDIVQGGGTKVLNFRRTASLDLLMQLMFRADGTPDLGVARSLMEMRAAMAPDIARLCARRASASQAQAVADVVASMRATDDLAELQTLSLDFWDGLVAGADNIAYELAFNTLRHTYDQVREALVHVLEDEIRDVDSYQSVADAVLRGDELAAKHVAAALMERGTTRMLEVIAALQQPEEEAEEGPEEEQGGAA